MSFHDEVVIGSYQIHSGYRIIVPPYIRKALDLRDGDFVQWRRKGKIFYIVKVAFQEVKPKPDEEIKVEA